MIKKRYSSLIFFLISISIALIWFCLDIKKSQDLILKFAIEYPVIKIEEHIKGQVTSIYQHDPKEFRIMSYNRDITINDTLKRRLNVDNELYTGRSLGEILSVGDSLNKQADSTTITIYKIREADTLKYRFPLLNEKLHPLKK
jgi:hypothetical protein